MSYFKLAAYTLIRVVMNTAYRMIYPFLAVFARGLGVDISVISGLVRRSRPTLPITIPTFRQ